MGIFVKKGTGEKGKVSHVIIYNQLELSGTQFQNVLVGTRQDYESTHNFRTLQELGEQWRTMENSRGACVPNCAQSFQCQIL